MTNFYKIRHLGLEHPVQDWPSAKYGAYYPETEQLHAIAGKVQSSPILASQRPRPVRGPYAEVFPQGLRPGTSVAVTAMLKWLFAYGAGKMQVSYTGAKNLSRVGAVLFNKNKNLSYWKWPPPIPNYIPMYGPWPSKPVAEGILCGGNTVNVIGTSGSYFKVECIKPFATSAPLLNRFTHPHLFARLWEVQIGTGAVRAGGLYWPLFAANGYAYIRKELLTK